MDDKVPVIPLKVMGDDVDLTSVFEGQGIQPFEKISQTMFSSKANGSRVVFGFGNDQIAT